MSVHIGINPLTWSNDDMPELGADIPLEQCLREGREAGYAGFELGHKFPRDRAVLTSLLARHGLALVSGWYSTRLLQRNLEEEIAAVQPHLELLLDMDCEVMVCAEVSGCIHGDRSSPLSARPRLNDKELADFAQRLTAFAEYLQSRGMRLAYHHHMGTVIESVDDIRRLMANSGAALGLLLDTGHLTYAGGDPAVLARDYGDRIVHLHCKDVRAPVLQRAHASDWSFLDAVLAGVFTVPGDGAIDFASVLRALPDTYSGWVVVEAEQDPAMADPPTYARMGYQYLAALLQKSPLAFEEII
ncbi:myo-inosose-2 dehydratase [Seongchinamella sediminis]|uniref:Myo-inosose-2 dehydratase n=1 Tax=Seongchinamella sediminis TaxID=2283635 RepID=A0A3L7DYK1_9GAMM|nr:myo-inosose-2 dehydratase [Seongchinamella sediminis]RLQ21739.1 myo-inosose-2 dehydratase [Seongchinamella sediminis]